MGEQGGSGGEGEGEGERGHEGGRESEKGERETEREAGRKHFFVIASPGAGPLSAPVGTLCARRGGRGARS